MQKFQNIIPFLCPEYIFPAKQQYIQHYNWNLAYALVNLLCEYNGDENGRDYGNSDSAAIALTSSLHPLITGNSNDCYYSFVLASVIPLPQNDIVVQMANIRKILPLTSESCCRKSIYVCHSMSAYCLLEYKPGIYPFRIDFITGIWNYKITIESNDGPVVWTLNTTVGSGVVRFWVPGFATDTQHMQQFAHIWNLSCCQIAETFSNVYFIQNDTKWVIPYG